MARISYVVAPAADQWSVTRNGETGMTYVSQEAAFEVAVGEASGDLRSGHDVAIEVRAALGEPIPRETTSGAESRVRNR